jgi:hypothetical protein
VDRIFFGWKFGGWEAGIALMGNRAGPAAGEWAAHGARPLRPGRSGPGPI